MTYQKLTYLWALVEMDVGSAEEQPTRDSPTHVLKCIAPILIAPSQIGAFYEVCSLVTDKWLPCPQPSYRMNTLRALKGRKSKKGKFLILVVEDNADCWLLIRAALAQRFPEAKPIWVNNTDQAMRYLTSTLLDRSKLPKLILLDLYLPSVEDGWALLATIKPHSPYQFIPVVVLSASVDQRDITKAYDLGVSSYIAKPVSFHGWLTCLANLRFYWLETASLPKHPK